MLTSTQDLYTTMGTGISNGDSLKGRYDITNVTLDPMNLIRIEFYTFLLSRVEQLLARPASPDSWHRFGEYICQHEQLRDLESLTAMGRWMMDAANEQDHDLLRILGQRIHAMILHQKSCLQCGKENDRLDNSVQ